MNNKRDTTFTIGGVRCKVEREYRESDDGQTSVDLEWLPRGQTILALTGEAQGSAGQCQDTIRELAEDHDAAQVIALCNIWDRWHLNDMRAGTTAQMRALAEDEFNATSYEDKCLVLRVADLYEDRGYRYGSRWLHEPLPADVINELEDLLDELDGARFGTLPGVDEAPEILGQDTVDSLDVIAALEVYRAAVVNLGFDPDTGVAPPDAEDRDFYVWGTYEALRQLDEEGSAVSPDWAFGETLISADYFTEYVEELAEETGAVNGDAGWPNNHIDWGAAAEELKHDYFELEYEGSIFYVRA